MAGDWIKMRTNLATDPRVVLISATLKKPRAHVIGALFILWALADDHSTDGRLAGYTAAVVDAAVGICGFAAAAEAAGWLHVDGAGSTIPRFDEHNGGTAKDRAQNARRQARKRNARVTDESRPRNGQCVTAALPRRDEMRREPSAEPDGVPPPSADEPSSPAPLCDTEVRIRRWVGDRISASDRNAIAKAELQAQRNPPVTIHHVVQPASVLFARAVDEAIASGGSFRSASGFLKLVGTIEARCARDGCWPGEGLERQNGHAKTSTQIVDEALAIDAARRSKP